jgi:crotonobetainyl-CoA:carnitine CoA-transferase CaiB-like acyl-CoA transferase
VLSGPICTMLLADMGAEIIKVERPGAPDVLRSTGARHPDLPDSFAFESLNRNKRSIALDPRSPEDADVLLELVSRSDVFVENFRPGAADALGFGYERCAEVRPGLVYGSISGFGQSGPLAGRGGYDLIAQAMSGIMSVTGKPDGVPHKVGVPIGDVAAGLYLSIGILAALRYRDMTGLGQHVDVSLLDAATSFAVWEAAEVWATGQVPQRQGNAHRGFAPYEIFPASDGWFAIAANTEELFRRAAAVFGITEVVQANADFATNAARVANRVALADLLAERTRTAPIDHWVNLLDAQGVPAGPVLDVAAALELPQIAARGMSVQPPGADSRVRILGNAIKMSITPPTVRDPAPRLNADADLLTSILREPPRRGPSIGSADEGRA